MYSAVVARVRGALPFRSSRPVLNRSLALFVVSGLLNMALFFTLTWLGVWLSGRVTGVPAFPPGWKRPF